MKQITANGKTYEIRRLKIKEIKGMVNDMSSLISDTIEFVTEEDFMSKIDVFILEQFEKFEQLITSVSTIPQEELEEFDVVEFKDLLIEIVEYHGIKKETVINFFLKLSGQFSGQQIQPLGMMMAGKGQFTEAIPKP